MTEFDKECDCGYNVRFPNVDCERCRMHEEIFTLRFQLKEEQKRNVCNVTCYQTWLATSQTLLREAIKKGIGQSDHSEWFKRVVETVSVNTAGGGCDERR